MNIPMILAAAEGNLAQETAAKFGFQFPLFISQCISFAIVAFLLHRFAYKPVLAVLEERRRKIAAGLADAAKMREQLAEAEQQISKRFAEAAAEAQRIIDEARSAGASLRETKAQEAIAEAEQIIAKAREASTLDRDRMMSELRAELGRLVVDTTAKVAGKVLTADDQRRLSEEAARQLAA
jgi:F-type H+-transporting ATPase subunit b